MAGITAFIGYREGLSLNDLLCKSLQASYPLPEIKTIVAETNSAQCAFGGNFPKHFQRKSELARLDDTTLLFYGELYNKLDGKTEAEFSLQTILNGGIESLRTLNGPFVLFVWDDVSSELTVVTDRLGRFPAFYRGDQHGMIITTDIHSVFNAGILTPVLDEERIADFLTIGFPLGEQSLFKDVKRMAGGNMLKVSRNGTMFKAYWDFHYANTLHHADTMVDTFTNCVHRAIERPGEIAVTLSGGWDSRTTCAVLPREQSSLSAVTYGVEGSTDAVLAERVAKAKHIPHLLASPEKDFFNSFDEWSQKVIMLSGGHLTIDLAFQVYMYDRFRSQFSTMIDSAGCEFRRGIRAQRVAEQATCTGDVSRFLASMYTTGIWNDSVIDKNFYREHSSQTVSKVTNLLDCASAGTYGDKIDFFSTHELWAHHYAYGYGLQTNYIGCLMPFSDNEFMDLYLDAIPKIRWSHKFHHAVIHCFAPALERIPISHGSCKVPYGESLIRYLPVIYHKGISSIASNKKFRWLGMIDNYKPFRPYHQWYSNELEEYVNDMLGSAIACGYVHTPGIRKLLDMQKQHQQDYSHSISILLTFIHLLEYVKNLRNKMSS